MPKRVRRSTARVRTAPIVEAIADPIPESIVASNPSFVGRLVTGASIDGLDKPEPFVHPTYTDTIKQKEADQVGRIDLAQSRQNLRKI